MRCVAIEHVHHDGIHHAPGDELELDEATATLLDAKGAVVALEPFSGAPVINGLGGGDPEGGKEPEPSKAADTPKATSAKGGAQAKGGSGKGKAAK